MYRNITLYKVITLFWRFYDFIVVIWLLTFAFFAFIRVISHLTFAVFLPLFALLRIRLSCFTFIRIITHLTLTFFRNYSRYFLFDFCVFSSPEPKAQVRYFAFDVCVFSPLTFAFFSILIFAFDVRFFTLICAIMHLTFAFFHL